MCMRWAYPYLRVQENRYKYSSTDNSMRSEFAFNMCIQRTQEAHHCFPEVVLNISTSKQTAHLSTGIGLANWEIFLVAKYHSHYVANAANLLSKGQISPLLIEIP